ncbi:unnamed protein product [Caenorhabditis brenneri]
MISLLRLPFFARESILHNMEFDELLLLSLTSRRVYKVIRYLRMKQFDVFFEIRGNEGRPKSIFFKESEGEKKSLRLVFSYCCETKKSMEEGEETRDAEKIKIGRFERECRLTINPQTNTPLLHLPEPDLKFFGLELYNHVLDLFKIRRDELIVVTSCQGLKYVPQLTQCKNFHLQEDATWIADGKELDAFLDYCRITNYAELYPLINGKLKNFHKLMKIDNLGLEWSKIQKKPCLTEFRGRHLCLKRSEFGLEDVFQFLNFWIFNSDNSHNLHLESLVITFFDEDFPAKNLLKRVDSHRWDPEQRPAYYEYRSTMKGCREEYREIDLHNAHDIVRQSDGTLASFIVQNDFFGFYVWRKEDLKEYSKNMS